MNTPVKTPVTWFHTHKNIQCTCASDVDVLLETFIHVAHSTLGSFLLLTWLHCFTALSMILLPSLDETAGPLMKTCIKASRRSFSMWLRTHVFTLHKVLHVLLELVCKISSFWICYVHSEHHVCCTVYKTFQEFVHWKPTTECQPACSMWSLQIASCG